MRVKIRVFSVLKRLFGNKSFFLELPTESTVKDLLLSLDEKYGEISQKENGRRLFDRVINNFNVFKNNEMLRLPDQINVVLKEDDEITILQPSGGG
jgi:molybdopterin converting factor small subunit